MKRQIVLLFSLCLLLSAASWAQNRTQAQGQKEIFVEGKGTYAVGENEAITLNHAKENAILRAKVNAIKNEFGERISIHEEELNDNYFRRVQAESRADWLHDVGKPTISVTYEGGVLTFHAEVKGIIREISAPKIDVKYKMLAGGGRETNTIVSGEQIFLKFKSPVDGNVAVYLIDDINKIATRMLPYHRSEQGFSVKAGKEYIFFDQEEDANAVLYKLSTDLEVETNRIAIIFSKNRIPPCDFVEDNNSSLDYTSLEAFNTWLYKCQNKDAGMVVCWETETIQKRKE